MKTDAPHVLCAGLFHETHTFVEGTTPLSAFAIRRGEQMLEFKGDASPWGGALELAATFDWQIMPVLDMRATPGAIVEDEVFEQFWQEFRAGAAGWTEEHLDAIFLVLHGAMVTPRYRDAEGELLRRIREELDCENIPVVAVLDLHANVTPLMAEHASALVTYRENPHADARDTAQRAVRLLQQHLETRVPMTTTFYGTDLIWPPGGTGTADEPMASLEALARLIEQEEPGVLEVNVCAGFSFADMREAGVSFSLVHTEECGDPKGVLERLGELAWERRDEGNRCGRPVEEILATLDAQPPGLIVLAEESDNIGGGAPGDGTGVLRALLAHGIRDGAVCLADRDAVNELWNYPAGARKTLALGGRGSRYDAGPVTLELEVVGRGDGRFELEDKNSHMASLSGDFFNMGRSVLTRHEGLYILLTSNRTPPMDLGQWRSMGVDPATLRVICVKGAVAHRRTYDPIAAANFLVDTPGPCRGDLRYLDYKHLRRPVFPLDLMPIPQPVPVRAPAKRISKTKA